MVRCQRPTSAGTGVAAEEGVARTGTDALSDAAVELEGADELHPTARTHTTGSIADLHLVLLIASPFRARPARRTVAA
jgi:hypothetical protein